MRKIFFFMLISLDGFFEGPNHDISWHNVDEEFNEFALQQMHTMDTLILGRRTYNLFHGFWPNEPKDPAISKEDLEVAQLINTLPKIVYSKSMGKVEEEENWKNITLKHEVEVDEIHELKQQPGKDIAIFGSNNLAESFLQKGLIDELRILVNPLLLGNGTRLFTDLHQKLTLHTLSTRTFKNGNVLITYQPL